MILIKILLLIILYVFLTLLGLILILIISPIKGNALLRNKYILLNGSYIFGAFKIHYEKDINETKLTIKFFGFRISTGDDTADKNKEKKVKEKTSKEKKKKYGIPSRNVISLSLQLVKKLIRIIAPESAQFHLLIGLDDPYYTGLLQMASNIIFIPLNRVEGYSFNVTPEHLDFAFEYDVSCKINFNIISLIIPILVFIFKKPIRDYLGLFQFNKKSIDKKRLSPSD